MVKRKCPGVQGNQVKSKKKKLMQTSKSEDGPLTSNEASSLKKSPNEGTAENVVTSKPASSSTNNDLIDGEFTEIEFNYLIKDEKYFMIAVEKFIQSAKNFPDNEKYDIVGGICQHGEGCLHIFNILNQKRPPNQIGLIFQLLECILIRIADDLSSFKKLSQEIISRLLTNHLYTVNYVWSKSRSSQTKTAALSLLSTIVSQTGRAISTILTQIKMQDIADIVANHKICGQDLRLAVIHFFMSFLVTGNNTTIKQFLSLPGRIFPNIFSGLVFDKISTLQLVLPIVHEKIVKNVSLTKTLKLKIFSSTVLVHLCQLYNWQGIRLKDTVDEKSKGRKKKNVKTLEISMDVDNDSDDKRLVRDLIHPIMMDLCCSTKLGVLFRGIKSDDTSKVSGNDTLYNVITHIKQPHVEGKLQDLLIGILTSCADLTYKYITTLAHLFVPRPTANWQLCIRFLEKVFSFTEKSSLPFVARENLSVEAQLSRCLPLVIPPKDILVTIVLKKPLTVFEEHVILHFIQRILRSCTNVVNAYNKLNCPESNKLRFKQLLQQHMYKASLPDSKTLAVQWKTSLNKEKKSDSGETEGLSNIPQTERMSTLLDVILLHQDFFQTFDSNWDSVLSIVLSCVMELSGDKSEMSSLYHRVLTLLSKVDSRIIPWTTKIDDKSLSYIVLYMYTCIKTDDIKQQTAIQKLTIQVLLKMGNFDGKEEELSIWLNHLLSNEHQEEVLGYLDVVFQSITSCPQSFIDMILEAVASTKTSSKSKKSAADNVEKLLQSLLKSKDSTNITQYSGDDEQKSTNDTNRLPFSILVTACLTKMNEDKDYCTDIIHEFISEVMIDVLHSQVDHSSLWEIISTYKGILSESKLFKYVSVLNQTIPAVPKKKTISTEILSSKDFSRSLQCCMLQGIKCVTVKDVSSHLTERVKLVPINEMMPATKHIMFCLNYVSQFKNNADDEIDKVLKVLFDLLELLLSYRKAMHLVIKETKLNMCRIILGHPVMINNFISTSKSQQNSSRKTFSNCVSSLVSTMSGQNIKFDKDLTEPYIDKIKSYFAGEQKDVDSLLGLVKPFCMSMDAELIVEIVQLLLGVLQNRLQKNEDVATMKHVVIDLLEFLLLERSSEISNHLPFSISSITTLMELLSSDSCDEKLLNVIDKLLIAFPVYCSCIGSSQLIELLNSAAESTIRLNVVMSVISRSRSCFVNVNNWIISDSIQLKHKSKYLPVITSYLEIVSEDKTHFSPEVINVLVKLYWKNFLKQLTKEDGLSVDDKSKVDVMTTLIPHLSEAVLMSSFTSLVEFCKDSSSIIDYHLQVLYKMLLRVVTFPDIAVSQVTQLIGSLSNIIKQYKKTESSILPDIFTTIKDAIKDSVSRDELCAVIDNDWMKMFRNFCRKYFDTPAMLSLITEIIIKLYTADSTITPSVKTMHEMVMSHSQFHDIMLTEQKHVAKDGLIELLTHLIILDSSCCHSDHVASLLSAYNATLSSTDVKLIYLLRLYETNVDMSSYRPFYWGQKAMDHHFTKKTVGRSLKTEPKMEDVMLYLDSEKVLKSALKFPLQRKLLASSISDNEKHINEEIREIYDPCFLIPFFSYLLRPEALVNCEIFVRRDCLGYVLCALSSYDITMRGAAYYILMNFISHLEGGRFSERQELQVLLKCIKNSVLRANYQMPCVVSLFLAKSSQILLQPGHGMYKTIMEFLLFKPAFDTKSVPKFFDLFFSTEITFVSERDWMLTLLCEGLRLADDYILYQKKRIFDLLMSFYESPLSTDVTQLNVFKILDAATKIRPVVFDLVKNHSLITWLSGTAQQCGRSPDLLDSHVDIIENLWTGMKSALNEDSPKIRSLFVNELLTVCFTVIDQFSDSVDIAKFKQFMSVLAEISTHFTENEFKFILSQNQMKKLFRIWADCSNDKAVIDSVDRIHTNTYTDISRNENFSCVNSNVQRITASLLIVVNMHFKDIDLKTVDSQTVQSSLLLSKWLTADSNRTEIARYINNECSIGNVLTFLCSLASAILNMEETESVKIEKSIQSLTDVNSKLHCLRKLEGILSISLFTENEDVNKDCRMLISDIY